MGADEFVGRLERAKKSGGGWSGRCPAHEDRNASLSVREGDDGRVLVKCHAGCTVEAVLAALNLEARDLFTEDPRPRAGSWEDRIEVAYDYTDEAGKLLYQAVRLRSPKDFRQRQQKPDGGWWWSLGNEEKKIPQARRVVYRLPEVLDAAGTGRAVWVCEGEKDVDALRGLGFAATCNPMGAGEGKWRDDYTEALAGAAFGLVVCDCDGAGRGHARAVAASLHAAGIRVKVIDLDAARDDGYDLSDFLAEHGEAAKELLERRAKATPAWQPGMASSEPALPIVSVKDFAASVPHYDDAKDYLGPFLHGGYRIHVAGPTGHGKTSFLLEAESAALRGSEFLGWNGKGGLRALHIDLEMPSELLWQAVRDARLEGVEGFDLLHLPDGLEVDTNQQHRRMLERAVEGYHIVTIDPWYKLVGQELEYSTARYVISLLDGLRERHPSMCMLVGFHAQEPKSPRARIDLGSISGFKFFHRPADIVLTFQRVGGDSSRVRWVKNRSPRLEAKIDEVWPLRWERGQGFSRAEDKKAADRLLALLTREPQTTQEVAVAFDKPAKYASKLLNQLARDGKIDCWGADTGGRGAEKRWWLHFEGEEVA